MSVLITGGSGFLARGLVEALKCRDDRICLYSRGEHAQALMRDEIDDPKGQLRWMIGDVRDLERLKWAMRGIETVIHTAALKRIEVGAYAPTEMVQTNILGTMNVIDAAASSEVKKVVGISSDKAWKPVSPYGLSKAMGECLLLAGDVERRGPRYRVVRYGNVAGSTGSVIPKWRAILKTTDTVPVTDPNCTRFWMFRDEAVRFVLADEGWGKVSVPILPAFSLGDLAEAMGAKMRVVGLPNHEKLHEGMEDDNTSDLAKRLTVDELRERLQYV